MPEDTLTEMDKLEQSYESYQSYPYSLVFDQSFESELESRARTLTQEAKRLFADERKAEVDFWQTDYEGQGMAKAWEGHFPLFSKDSANICLLGFRHYIVRSLKDMHLQLRLFEACPRRFDPNCRFVYVRGSGISSTGLMELLASYMHRILRSDSMSLRRCYTFYSPTNR